jgi:predicted permease
MRFLQSLCRRWRSLVAKDTSNLALREELHFHLERETEENITRGMSLEQARNAARASFGSLTQATEESYAARGVARIEDLAQDLRHGLRSLRRDLAATLTIVLLLSFGLSAATLLFTALNRWVLRPFNVGHPETLVRAAIKRPSIITRTSFSYENYQSIRHMSSLHDLAAVADFDTTITTGDASQSAIANMVSGNYFELLGVAAQLGRVLGPADEQPASPPVVISHQLWMNRFGGSPSAVGSVISLQGRPFVIAGVMPRDFFGTSLDSSPDLWLPFSAQPLLSKTPLGGPQADRYFGLIARLPAGVSISHAEAELDAAYQAQEAADKEVNSGHAILEPIEQGSFAQRDSFRSALSLLSWGLAAFLGMICANVAGLLLALALRHERDTALRAALGASRAHLVRRALTESLSLGVAGAAGGLVLSYAFAPLLQTLLPAGLAPVPLAPGFPTCCLAVAFALSVSLIFGALPAWVGSRIAPEQALRRGASTRRAGFLSRSLLILQISLTFVLLVASGLLLHTYYALRNTSPGFDVDHLVEFTLNGQVAGTADKLSPTLPFQLEEQVRNIPGVRGATLSSGALMRRIGLKTSVAIPGQRIAKESFLNTTMNRVSRSYFDTLRIPILGGSIFDPQPQGKPDSSPIPVVVNQAFVRSIFHNQNPIGKSFGNAPPGQVATAKYVVAGIAGDSKYRSLREEMLPIFYAPLLPRQDGSFVYVLYVSTQGPATAIIGAVKRAQSALDPRLPFFDVVTMRDRVTQSLWQERLLATLSLLFAFIAVFMAVVGLHGLLSYDTTQRTREFGIRAAVGAQKLDVAELLMADLLRILAPGVAAGIVMCLLASRLVGSVLYGVRPLDPASFAAALVIVACTVAAAGWQPMQRAMGVDPAIVLREDA